MHWFLFMNFFFFFCYIANSFFKFESLFGLESLLLRNRSFQYCIFLPSSPSSFQKSRTQLSSLIKVKVNVLIGQCCLILCDPLDCSSPGSSVHGLLQARITGVACHFLLEGIFLTQELNLGLLCRRQILYYLSHQGSPRVKSI